MRCKQPTAATSLACTPGCVTEREPEAGKPLVRELAGCRSIRIGGSENRLVYRYHRDAELVEMIAIERRRGGEAYEVAAQRLPGP